MRSFFVIMLYFLIIHLMAQDSLLVGKPYLEDQVYFAMSYNNILDKKDNIKQSGLSLGLQGGFIKDIPLNSRQNLALGIGIGYDYTKIQSNLSIDENANLTFIEEAFNKNKLEFHSVEIPLEFRYRTSADNVFKFWRIYGGVKLNYVFYKRYIFQYNQSYHKVVNPPILKSWQIGPQITIGYNTWNFYTYWNVTPFVQTKQSDNDIETLSYLKLGLRFYIF